MGRDKWLSTLMTLARVGGRLDELSRMWVRFPEWLDHTGGEGFCAKRHDLPKFGRDLDAAYAEVAVLTNTIETGAVDGKIIDRARHIEGNAENLARRFDAMLFDSVPGRM